MDARCGKCNHRWFSPVPLPIELSAFCAMLQGIICPACGGDSRTIYVGGGDDHDRRTDGTPPAVPKAET